ncbi:MAG: isocitrate lyase/PEP mutase family protein, partial [Candidatus Acidiferrum sp.]
ASARIIEKAGARAIATSSAGVAFSLGYPDGQNVPPDLMLEAIARIAASVHVPVTADVEAGYGSTPQEMAQTTLRVIQAGAVGLNLEDATNDPSRPLFSLQEQVERIRAVREAAERAGIRVVINARTDVFLGQIGEPAKRLEESVRRLNAYRSAGADCLFIPGVTDAGTISELVRQVSGPINVLIGPGMPSTAELQKIGIARVSAGSGIMRAAITHARDAAVELLTKGSYNGILEKSIPFQELNDLMK